MDLSEIPAQRDGDRMGSPVSRHPWETSRAKFFTRILEESSALRSSSRILDAGAGDAWFARKLLERYPGVKLSCWDIEYTAQRLASLEQETAGKIRFLTEMPEGEYDALVLLDVLEHVEDAGAFLAKLVNEHLVSGGAALVSVPAWQALFSRHDTALRHCRRYSPRQLARVVEDAGLERLRGGGLFHSLVLPRALGVAKERLFRDASAVEPVSHELRWERGALITSAVRGALWLDNLISRLSSRMRLQVPGLTVWCLCRKP